MFLLVKICFLGLLMVLLDLGDVQYRLTPKRSNKGG